MSMQSLGRLYVNLLRMKHMQCMTANIIFNDSLSFFSSATRDSRFSPISTDEIHRLEVAVSLLLNFEEGKDYLDWEVRK